MSDVPHSPAPRPPAEAAPPPAEAAPSMDSTKFSPGPYVVVPVPERAVCVYCPHCHSPLQVSGDPSQAMVCQECGSSFRLEAFHEAVTTEDIRVLGKFQLLERVGQGAFGSVWRARDRELDRIVALKVPHASLLTTPGYRERFQREARAAAQLRHPGIVRLYEVPVIEGVPLLVSDFIEGVPLRDVIEIRRLTFREAAALVADVAEALDYAHNLGLIHRDIKPGNIMMECDRAPAPRPESQPGPDKLTTLGKPIIVDFGLALREEAEIVMTVEGQVIGTPAYMSPEQAAGKGHPVDRRSDVYSLGVILYQLLTGELPFRGSKAMLIHQVLHEEPKAPRRINDKIPRDLETICLMAMAKLPAWRYATAAALAEDLRRYLGGEPIRARPITRGERLWRWCRRKPALAAMSALAGAALMALVAVGITFSLHQARSVREYRRLSATLALDRGLNYCEQGDVHLGMLWLARSLEIAPSDAADLQRTIRLNLAGWYRWASPLRAFLPHDGPVVAGRFHPDKRTLVTASLDNKARMWDSTSGARIGSPFLFPSQITTAAFSSSGDVVATVSDEKTVQVWDLTSHKPRGPPLVHEAKVATVALSPDGKTVLSACADGPTHVWNLTTGQKVASLPGPSAPTPTIRVDFSPDGRICAMGAWGEVQIWDATTWQPRVPALRQDVQVHALAFSPGGEYLLIGAVGSARLWNVALGKLQQQMPHAANVTAVAFTADGRTILTGSADKSARFWDAATGKPIGPILPHADQINAVSFSPDDSLCFTAAEKLVRVRQIFDQSSHGKVLPCDGPVGRVAFSRDDKVIVTASWSHSKGFGQIAVWDADTGALRRSNREHRDLITSLAISPDGGTLVSGSADETARIISMATGESVVLKHQGWVHAVAFSPDSKLVVTGSATARFWDSRGRPAGPALEHGERVRAVAFSPNGDLVLTGGEDDNAKLWNVATRQLVHTFPHGSQVEALAFSPDGKTALTGSFDKTARLWNIETGAPIGEPLAHEDNVQAVAFSPNGTLVATASADKTVRLWDAGTGKAHGTPMRHSDRVYAIAFSPDSKILLSGSGDKTARLWDAATAKPLGPPLRHDAPVNSVAFSHDGKRVASASKDARIWDIPGPVEGEVQRIMLWVQVVTGMELDSNEAVRGLDTSAWQSRRQRLQGLGGPPVP